ncbi:MULTISPECIES: hypothetical protein [Sorangium]|uniref:Uncharacterized protein n=1 Tax=Sorangium cellulosum TaxID=56 RepID=A0A4P2QKV6_SORCE|nr:MULTISPECIES: hypothetical protein [Sorangium]AUX30406.1 uncharacterized protein SOCE836_025090 [Sorangium cellulosum]WCQ89800.1 hypothetical protein NQZ70_02492 [Sorangium sp. Soce836]
MHSLSLEHVSPPREVPVHEGSGGASGQKDSPRPAAPEQSPHAKLRQSAVAIEVNEAAPQCAGLVQVSTEFPW